MSEQAGNLISVDLWGSNPDEGNDDCFTGEEFPTLEQARERFSVLLASPSEFPSHQPAYQVAFIVLSNADGSVWESKANPAYDAARNAAEDAAFERECRSERATQAGMEFGCDGYNDAMGY